MHREGLEQVAVENDKQKIIGVLAKDEVYSLVVRGLQPIFVVLDHWRTDCDGPAWQIPSTTTRLGTERVRERTP